MAKPSAALERREEQMLRLSVKTFLFDAPIIHPTEPPVFRGYDAESSFLPRFGASIVYLVHVFHHSVSPSGVLGAYLRLLVKWFVVFGALVVVVGVLGKVMATFMESISRLFLLAAQNTFAAVLYLAGTVLIVAVLAAGVVLIINLVKNRSSADAVDPSAWRHPGRQR